jgi:hypothetical protein
MPRVTGGFITIPLLQLLKVLEPRPYYTFFRANTILHGLLAMTSHGADAMDVLECTFWIPTLSRIFGGFGMSMLWFPCSTHPYLADKQGSRHVKKFGC